MLSTFKRVKNYFTLILGLFFLFSSQAYCEMSKNEIPRVVIAGLTEYKTKGPEAAINAWIKDSPYEGSKEAISQANSFRQIETFYGKYIDYHLIHITNLTPSNKLVYISMNFEKGPVFAAFLLYKTKEDWILTGKFNFNTDPNTVIPEFIVEKK